MSEDERRLKRKREGARAGTRRPAKDSGISVSV